MNDTRGPVVYTDHTEALRKAKEQGGTVIKVPGANQSWAVATVDMPIPRKWELAMPSSRSTDPETSQRAATKAAINAASNRARLLIAHHEAGQHGLTGDDIEAATGIAYQAIGPRRPSLERAGLVAKAIGDDGQYITRNDKQVYRITSRGAIEARRLQREDAA